MNENNLKPFNKKTAKTNGAKGGKASGEAKREKKRIKEIIAELMEQEASDIDLLFNEYKLDFYSNSAVIAMKLTDKAKRGDTKAVKLLLEILGELDKNNEEKESQEYQKGYSAGQADVFKNMTEKELVAYLDRIAANLEIPVNEKAVVLPDGRVILGENELE